jgi:hypothetical protein
MVKILDPKPYGALSEKNLQNFETSLGCPLPSDYREFLLQYNGGKPAPGFFWIVKGEDGSEVNQFYGLHEGPKWLSIAYEFGKSYGLPTDMLAIGDDGTGNLLCIEIAGPQAGSVYFLDHEAHPKSMPDACNGIYKLAGSFSEFLGSLTQQQFGNGKQPAT